MELGDFEWDPAKSTANWEKHGIDFETATEVFHQEFHRVPSNRNGETRWIAIGSAGNRIVAVVYTDRGDRIRIISARVARTNEREAYNRLYGDTS